MSAPLPQKSQASPFKDVLIGGLALATVGLTIAVWQQRTEIRRLSAAVATAVLEPAPGNVKLRTATSRSLTLVTPPTVRASDERARATEQSFDETYLLPSRPTNSRPAPVRSLAQLIANPEFFQALALHRQAALDARFAGLFRRLDLGADELAAFKRLLAEKENVALDVVAVSESQPDGPLSDEMIGASVNASRARVEDAIHASLGDERYAVYRDYSQTFAQRTAVAQLEQRLSYSPTPLSPAQSESLVRILVAHAPAAASAETAPTSTVVVGTGRLAATPLVETHAPTAVVTNEVLVEAQAVLAPQQIAALRDLRVEQDASARALQLIRENLPAAERTAAGRLIDLLLQ